MLVLPSKNARIWERFLEENQTLVYKYIVREIKKGIKENKEVVDLFKFDDNSMHAWVKKTNYLTTLNSAKEVFIKAEEYENAKKTDDVIRMYYIEQVIRESIKEE